MPQKNLTTDDIHGNSKKSSFFRSHSNLKNLTKFKDKFLYILKIEKQIIYNVEHMNKSYNFFINDRKFTVNFDLVFANKIGTKISTELYNSGEYFVQSKVTDQIFEIFLHFLIGKTDYPEVDAND